MATLTGILTVTSMALKEEITLKCLEETSNGRGILLNRLSRKEISNKDVKKFDKYVEKKCDLGYSTRKG